MTALTHTFVGTSNRNRSAITNGSWLLEGVDNRKADGRRFRDLCVALAEDIGAKSLTTPQQAMVRQAAALTLETERMQAKIVRGEPVDHEQLVRVSNLLTRVLRQLGIKEASSAKKASNGKLDRIMAGRSRP